MIGAGAVQLFPVSRFSNADALLSLLVTGGPAFGRIVPEVSGVALALHQFRLPLPPGTHIPAGTVVEVRIVEHGGAKQLQLRPQTPSEEAAPAQLPRPGSAALSVLSDVLAALPSSVNREQAAAILPRLDALPRETLRALLQLLVGHERLGAAAARLAEAASVAVASGRLPAAVSKQISTVAGRMLAENAAEFERAIRDARDILAGRPPVTHAADRLHDKSLVGDLIALREQMQAHPRAASTQTDAVIRAIDTLLERLDNGRMQNVRGFEAPYQFLEIPLSAQTGFDRAQIHFFGDESSNSPREAKSHSIVLDLELSQLGPIWIALHATGQSCACVLRVESESAREALSEASPALQQALRAAGYDGATVRTEPWDGDRVSALAAMSARFAGFEATA